MGQCNLLVPHYASLAALLTTACLVLSRWAYMLVFPLSASAHKDNCRNSCQNIHCPSDTVCQVGKHHLIITTHRYVRFALFGQPLAATCCGCECTRSTLPQMLLEALSLEASACCVLSVALAYSGSCPASLPFPASPAAAASLQAPASAAAPQDLV
jgi:hypothetical protein